MTLTLSGEPKSTQHIYGLTCRGRFATRYMTPQGNALKEDYQWEAKSQWRKPALKDELAVTVRFFFGTKRKADLDNFNRTRLPALSTRTTAR